MCIPRLLIVGLFGLLLVPAPSAANTIIFGALNLPDTSSTGCTPVCPELTTSPGRGRFTLVSTATIEAVFFWTLESPGSYLGGALDWRIYTENSGVPGTLLDSGQFTLAPRNFLQSINLNGLPLDEYRNEFTLASALTIVPVSAPQNYFLEIQESSAHTDGFGIFMATANPSSLAFQLQGTGNGDPTGVPEPVSFYLSASALLGIAAWRRLRTTH